MKLSCSCVCAGLAGGLSVAHADGLQSDYPEGFYGWYEAGPAFVAESELRNFFGNPIANNAVDFKPGFHFGLGIGQELTRYLKVEVESGFNYNALDAISGATSSEAKFYRVPVLANVVLQLPNRTGITPVIGAGVGGQWLSLDADNITIGATALSGSDHTWVFSYQGYAGVQYEFSERFGCGVFYHCNVADAPAWNFHSPPGNLKLDSLNTHSVSFTLGWWF